MKIGFIGDIVGKPGREMLKKHLQNLRSNYGLDLIIANYENVSHGFGLTTKNCEELLSYGIDVMTGGNHSFDKKEIFEMFDKYPIIRPMNYPKNTPGKGLIEVEVIGKKVAILNLMGHYTMPLADNPFTQIIDVVKDIKNSGIKHIILDFHAEATAEKNAIREMLKTEVSAIMGTHTHIATDDLKIIDGCCYITDVGLTGCDDSVIGMSSEVPIKRMLTGLGGHLDIPKECKSILQMVLFELNDEGQCIDAKKVKIYGDNPEIVTPAWVY